MATKRKTTKKKSDTGRRAKAPKSPKRAPDQATVPAENKPAKAARPRQKRSRTGLLDLAADVLRDAKDPMTCAEMVEAVLAKGSWSTKGKTPAASLNAAIHRELKDKGKDARFKKVERGRFAAQGGGR